jgi:hypothetical protein
LLRNNNLCLHLRKDVAGAGKSWLMLPMSRTLAARRYTIEIKDAEGTVVVSAVAHWDDKDKRSALAQIERFAPLPQVNFYTGPALAPQSGYSRQRRPGTGWPPDKET